MNLRSISCGVAALAVLAASGAARAQSSDIQGLHDALHLSAAQESAWRAYRQDTAPDPGAEARHQSAQQMLASLNTPRRIDLVTAEMEADLAAMKKGGAAVKAFYKQLTPAQQAIFDRQTLQAGEGQGAGQDGDPGGDDMPPPHS